MKPSKVTFGKRGVATEPSLPSLAEKSEQKRKPVSPLFKQLGGVAIGVGIAGLLFVGQAAYMKDMGRKLARDFDSNFGFADPVPPSTSLSMKDREVAQIHGICLKQAQSAELTNRQKRSSSQNIDLFSGESKLLQGAEFIQCISAADPVRFCKEPHKQHLLESVRGYFALRRQVLEVRSSRFATPGSANFDAMNGIAHRPSEIAKVGFPSANIDPAMLANLKRLVADGYLSERDLRDLDRFGRSQPLLDAIKNIKKEPNPC